MPMAEFKVGDRVEAIGKVDGRDLTGQKGTVVKASSTLLGLGIEFDIEILDGHNCNGLAKDKHGRYGSSKAFKLIGENNMKTPTQLLVDKNLTPNQRLLMRHELEHANGSPTGNGENVLLARLWSEHRDAIADDLKAAIKQEKQETEEEKA